MSDHLNLVRDYLKETGLAVHDPATGSLIAHVADHMAADVEAAVLDAEKAQKDWAGQTAKARAGVLRRWHDLILGHADELAALATLECGKPLSESKGEALYAASFLEWFAEEAKRVEGDILQSHAADKTLMVLKEPVGVTAAITPWNFPLAMITRKAAPALAAGCAILVKPAETTPLSAYALEALAYEAGVPRGLYRTFTTTDPQRIGTIFCGHPKIRKLSFTGSTTVGKHLLKQAAEGVKRVSMELGGNAPFIVFDDADLDAAVSGALASKYRNAGQTCVCANRILVQDGIHDAFVQKLTEAVQAFQLGAGSDAGTEIGPLITSEARDKVSHLVSRAEEEGATVAVGGAAVDGPGYFYAPTVLTGVTAKMGIAQTEIFGPVAPVIRFKGEAEAIEIANDTPYGLAAYFYANDMRRVWRVLEGLEYGIVGVNEGIISTEVAPFGGMKESGLGREGSRYGIDEYLEMKYACFGSMK